MSHRLLKLCIALVVCVPSLRAQSYPPAPPIPGQNVIGMHIYIRAGLKTHAPGLHDYPQFNQIDWRKSVHPLLSARNW